MTGSPQPRYKVAAITPFSRNALIVAAALVALFAVAPLFHLHVFGRPQMQLVIDFCTLLALAQMWNLLAGYSGLVSVGQQAFVGLGAYTLFFFAVFRGTHPLLAVVLAGVIAGILALPTASLVFRLKGAYFAIGTWVVAEVYKLAFAQMIAFGGGSGKSLPANVVRSLADTPYDRQMVLYWLALALAAGSIGLVYALLRSRFGLALAAIRDSEPAAESLGVDTAATKRFVYVIAAVVTGLCGAVIALKSNTVSPGASFDVINWTAYVIFIVVIGGVGRIEGPIVGTVIYFVLRGFLADQGTVYLIILGGLAVVMMLAAPRGVWGLIVRFFGVEVFPVRRRLVLDKDSGS